MMEALKRSRKADTGNPAVVAGDKQRPIFSVKDLTVGFADREDVLRDVSMNINAGEVLVLLGPSGCGKTTVLNIAAGLLNPRAGVVDFDGAEIKGVNTAVGYMTQDDTLLPWLSVSANVGVPLKLRGHKRSEIKSEVDKYLELLDLKHAAELYPGQLSGGMRRRALLARSMIYNPKLLLMDEPFAALDAQMRHQMHLELLSAVKKINQTVMFVTHDIAEAAKIGDRVLVFGGGPPGGIVEEVVLPFGPDRDLEKMRYSDEFASIERQLDESLIKAKPRHKRSVNEGEEK